MGAGGEGKEGRGDGDGERGEGEGGWVRVGRRLGFRRGTTVPRYSVSRRASSRSPRRASGPRDGPHETPPENTPPEHVGHVHKPPPVWRSRRPQFWVGRGAGVVPPGPGWTSAFSLFPAPVATWRVPVCCSFLQRMRFTGRPTRVGAVVSPTSPWGGRHSARPDGEAAWPLGGPRLIHAWAGEVISYPRTLQLWGEPTSNPQPLPDLVTTLTPTTVWPYPRRLIFFQ